MIVDLVAGQPFQVGPLLTATITATIRDGVERGKAQLGGGTEICPSLALWHCGKSHAIAEGAMKVHIDIDCTPEEARTFFGLPDLQPMQEAVMNEMQDRMMAAMRSMDPETLIRTWLPAGIANLEQMQKIFWQQFDPNAAKKK
jgi:hypothetical protein